MTGLIRYQAALLARSHRWVFPLVSYALLISLGGIGRREPATVELGWSAAMLVPAVALLTRSMLTAEPASARACASAAAGPRRAQLAVLIAALGAGLVLGLAGAGYALAMASAVPKIADLVAGLVTIVVCAIVGSAIATLCNPPVIRHPAVALLSTVTAAVIALVSGVSPANAALRGTGAALPPTHWPTGVPFLTAAVLLAISWAVSAWLAARRGAAEPSRPDYGDVTRYLADTVRLPGRIR